ncbi:MAG: transglycosylase SLT domain-containing protein [Acidobacteriota bacterium]
MKRRYTPLTLVVCLTWAATGCSGTLMGRPAVAAPEPKLAAPIVLAECAPLASPEPDVVDLLIASAQSHFERGQAQLALGHLESARAEFDQAVEFLLGAPDGARGEPRTREYFDRLVDRISAQEIRALAEGDGFTEKPAEPSSLDELLGILTFEPPTPEPGLAETVETDLRTTMHDIPIPLNARVLGYVEAFQGRLREWFQTALDRGGSYLPMIQEVFRAEGLPLDLAYIPIIESAFRTNALSRARAKGFWQLMVGTGKEQGLKTDWYIDERSDPYKSTRAAARYLKSLNRMFDGDWHLTLASYNGGPGTVQRAIRRKRSDDYWTIAEQGRYLPRETRAYVPMVLAAIVIARNPAGYGFSYTPSAPPEMETVSLTGPVDLRRIAEWTGVSIDEIQGLNPELRRWTTPLRGDSYALKVPSGAAAAVEQRLAQTPAEELATLQYHTVRKGESLASIARTLRVKRADLAEANYLRSVARVSIGQQLVIPRAPTALLAAQADRPAASGVGMVTPDGGEHRPEKTTYRVRRGDTLYGIARTFNTTVATLRSLNRLSGDRILPGELLTVHSSRRATGGQQ